MRDTATGSATRSATDWTAHDAPSMWRMIAPQVTDAHWRHVAGLRKLTELTATHMARLQVYRDHLAEAWPPEKSPAARAFIARLDYLIGHVRATHEVAATNYSALSTATLTLDSARTKVASINAEYAAKLATLKDYEDLVEQTKASQVPGTSLGPPPVAAADMERLNVKARTIMTDLSHTLVLAQTQLRRPTPYESSGPREDPALLPKALSTVPTIPVLEPPSKTANFDGVERLGGSASHLIGHDSTLPVANQVPENSPRAVATASRSVLLPTATSMPAVRRDPKARSAPGLSNSNPTNRSPSALPSGGVIGRMPSSAGPHGSGGTSRPNPPGGVITGSQPAHFPQQRGQGSSSSVKRRDPDHPWETRQGVPPVVTPPAINSDFDPGPTIGVER
ncbi:hypothetical protein DFJ67_3026 [Asanoa ferruginea]|uniref:Uncharacterized protein n=1 Tax=Asanoa ferruginea TaxID=53367 RepID=A0A3D9ZIG6_9ACTN|nr:hypothetical protein DFJ67_3026 [Asanoa ferruginea]GIF50222.1 hypothetical protein Afe04nite_47610 [Asanoa ferruginea]